MKKLLFTILILSFSTLSFSQKSNVITAYNNMLDGRYEKAKEYIDKAVANPKTSDSKKAWYYRGQIYYHIAESLDDPFSYLIESNKSMINARELGYEESEVSRYIDAISALCYNKAVLQYKNGNYDKAMEYFYQTYIYSNYKDQAALYNAALAAELAKNISKAALYYSELYKQDYHKEELYTRAPSVIAKSGNIDLALEMIKKAKVLYPDNNDILIGEINIYLTTGDAEKSLPLIRKAIEGNSDNASLYFALGTLYENMDGYRYEAENAYKKAIEIEPDFFDAYYNLGAMYVNTAFDIQEKANNFPIDKVKEYNELTKQATKNLEIAVPYLEKAYKINPYDQSLTNALKMVYVRLKLTGKINALNDNSLSEELKNEVDRDRPEIMIISPSNSRGFKILDPYKTTESTIRIAGQAIDENGIKKVTYNNRSIPFENDGYFSFSAGLTDGFNAVYIKAIDLFDNESTIELYFTKEVKTKAVSILQSEEAISRQESDYYALIIGVNDYDDPSVNDLDYPISDALRFYEVITTYYTFKPENITFIKNPGREELYNAFEDIHDLIDEKDNLLIFYAGHGYWDQNIDRGYWLPSDAKAGRKSSWFSNTDLTDFIKSYSSRHTLLISDACFSGSIFKTRAGIDMAPKDIVILNELPSRTAITSGTLTEVPDKSVFIEYLVKRLKQNTEKFLTTEGLFNSFRRAVISNSVTDQVPQYGSIHMTGDEGGEFIFIKKD